jgi:peptide/nickel transport system ATP-binding protein
MSDTLLDVQGLRTRFATDRGTFDAVDGVSFQVHAGEAVGLVGESGCGKSVTAMSLLRLIPEPPGRIVGGTAMLSTADGPVDLLSVPLDHLRKLRGDRVAMIFQEPMTALNPVYTVGEQVAEALELHRGLEEEEARAAAIQALKQVGIPAAEERVDAYPHQLSGGMRQRVMIAMALSCDPDLLIADEPTTALDVTVQAQILDLLASERRRRKMALLLITHDLGVIAETCDRVIVMYAGRVAESGTTADVLERPTHPYTVGLLASLPGEAAPRSVLNTIPGMVPGPMQMPTGCRFRTRCAFASDACAEVPAPTELSAGHIVHCHHPVAR